MATQDLQQTQNEQANPKTVSSDYQAMASFWKMVDAILNGAEAMRAVDGGQGVSTSVAGPIIPYAQLSLLNNPRRGRDGAQSPYLPQLPNEENIDYDYRRKHAPFTNIFADISRNLSGKPFSKTLELDEGTDQRYLDLQDDIDGEGNSLHVFASHTFKAGIDKAIDWILVDYNNVAADIGANPTLADERNAGARPYWVHISCEKLLAVYSDFINGQEIITHARVYEPFTELEDYEEQVTERVRVYFRDPLTFSANGKATSYGPAQWLLYELVEEKDPNQKEKKSWQIVDAGNISIGIIPLVPFRTGERETSSWQIKPPLRDLAFMQVEEFQQESNLKSIKEAAAFPMLAGNGVEPAKDQNGQDLVVPVGPKAVLFAPPQGAGRTAGSWTYIEPAATSMTFLAADLDKLRTEMRDLGMQPLTVSNQTVITTANLSAKAHSSVQVWALALKDALEQAFYFTSLWLGDKTADIEVKVHTDFGVDIDAQQELPVLLTAETQGIITKRTVGEEFKRRGVLSDDWDPDEEAKMLAKQNAALTPEIPIDPVTGKPLSGTPFKPGAPTMTLEQQLAAKKKDVAASVPPTPKGQLQ